LIPENINFADFPLIHFIKDPVFYYVPNEALIDADDKYLIQKSIISKNLDLMKVLGITDSITDFDSDFELVFFGNIDYEKSRFDLVNLPLSEFELDYLKNISEKNEIKFSEFSKTEASKENFVNVKSGDLFYLSMHSISDKINFYDSQMYFNDDFLTIKDMLDFNFEDISLFYLASCETDASIKIPNVLPVTLSSLISNYGSKGVVGTKQSIEDTIAFINGAAFTQHYIESGFIPIALYKTLNELINLNAKISKPKYWTKFSYYGF